MQQRSRAKTPSHHHQQHVSFTASTRGGLGDSLSRSPVQSYATPPRIRPSPVKSINYGNHLSNKNNNINNNHYIEPSPITVSRQPEQVQRQRDPLNRTVSPNRSINSSNSTINDYVNSSAWSNISSNNLSPMRGQKKTAPQQQQQIRRATPFNWQPISPGPDQKSEFALRELSEAQREQIIYLLATAPASDVSFVQLSNGEILASYKATMKPHVYVNPQPDASTLNVSANPNNRNLSQIRERVANLTNKDPDNRRALIKRQQSISARAASERKCEASSTKQVEGNNKKKQGAVRSLVWVLRLIEDIYNARYQSFVFEMQSLDCKVEGLSSFVFKYLTKQFGLDSLVKQIGRDLLQSVKQYRSINRQIEMFGLFLTPHYSVLDLMFYLECRHRVMPESSTGDIPYDRKLKIGSTPQTIPFKRLKHLTRRCLYRQPSTLINSILTDVKEMFKRKLGMDQNQSSDPALSPSAAEQNLRIELHEYLMLLLVHYKALRETKDMNGKEYFTTINPLDIPLRARMRMTDLTEVILLHDNSRKDPSTTSPTRSNSIPLSARSNVSSSSKHGFGFLENDHYEDQYQDQDEEERYCQHHHQQQQQLHRDANKNYGYNDDENINNANNNETYEDDIEVEVEEDEPDYGSQHAEHHQQQQQQQRNSTEMTTPSEENDGLSFLLSYSKQKQQQQQPHQEELIYSEDEFVTGDNTTEAADAFAAMYDVDPLLHQQQHDNDEEEGYISASVAPASLLTSASSSSANGVKKNAAGDVTRIKQQRLLSTLESAPPSHSSSPRDVKEFIFPERRLPRQSNSNNNNNETHEEEAPRRLLFQQKQQGEGRNDTIANRHHNGNVTDEEEEEEDDTEEETYPGQDNNVDDYDGDNGTSADEDKLQAVVNKLSSALEREMRFAMQNNAAEGNNSTNNNQRKQQDNNGNSNNDDHHEPILNKNNNNNGSDNSSNSSSNKNDNDDLNVSINNTNFDEVEDIEIDDKLFENLGLWDPNDLNKIRSMLSTSAPTSSKK